jgi:hypothetical protein
LLCLLLLLPLCGCARFAQEGPRPASVALATEGPPLALVGEYEGRRLEGFMDRNCMAGYGNIALRSIGTASPDLAVNLPRLSNAHDGEAAPAGKASGRSKNKTAKRAFPAALALDAYHQHAAPGPAQADAAPSGAATPQGRKPADERMDPSAGLVLGAYEAEERAPAAPPPAARAVGAARPTPSQPIGLGGAFVCRATMDHPPTEKGRIRGVLHCTGDRKMLVTLRNIGPDQGVGIGREDEYGDLMILFYHASLDEAWRRFPAVKADIVAARERQ